MALCKSRHPSRERKLAVTNCSTALAADSIFEHLRGFSKPIAVQRFTKQKRSLLTVLGYTIGITIGGIFSSIVPAAAAMTVGAGSKWMKAAEAFSVLAGNLPINMYGVFNLIHENGKSTHDFFERILCLSSGEGPLSLEKIDRQERANLLRLWFLSTLQKATHTIISEERIEDLEQFNGLSLLLYIAKQISVKEKSALEVESSKYKNNMRKAFGWFGAIFGELELTGYFMSTKCLMDAFFSPFGLSWVSTPIILAIPAYLSYLFGYKTFTTVWDMIGDLFHGKFTKTFSMQLYPKAATTLIVMTAICACFAWATGTQLVEDNFNESTADILKYLVGASAVMFNGFSAVISVEFFIKLYAKKFGQPRERKLAKFADSMETLFSDIELINDESLLLAFYSMTIEQRVILLRHTLEEIMPLLPSSEEGDLRRYVNDSVLVGQSSFWGRHDNEDTLVPVEVETSRKDSESTLDYQRMSS